VRNNEYHQANVCCGAQQLRQAVTVKRERRICQRSRTLLAHSNLHTRGRNLGPSRHLLFESANLSNVGPFISDSTQKLTRILKSSRESKLLSPRASNRQHCHRTVATCQSLQIWSKSTAFREHWWATGQKSIKKAMRSSGAFS